MNASMGRQRRKLWEGIMEISPNYTSWCHGEAPYGQWWWDGRGFSPRAEKTRSQRNDCEARRRILAARPKRSEGTARGVRHSLPTHKWVYGTN